MIKRIENKSIKKNGNKKNDVNQRKCSNRVCLLFVGFLNEFNLEF